MPQQREPQSPKYQRISANYHPNPTRSQPTSSRPTVPHSNFNPPFNRTAHKPSSTLETRCWECTMHMPHTQQWCRGSTPRRRSALGHTMAQVPDAIRSRVPYGTNKRRQPKQGGRAGGCNKEREDKSTQDTGSQAKLQTHAWRSRRRFMC